MTAPAQTTAPSAPPDTLAPARDLAELRQRRAWLAWGFVPSKKPDGKPRKVPSYVRGPNRGKWRRGEQGSPEDRAGLGTFAEAQAFAQRGGLEGVGLALLPELGIVALDFDACAEGDSILPDVAALVADTYAERSPSGRGVRALYVGELPPGWRDRKAPKRGERGFETFTGKGFVTFTGAALPHVDELALIHGADYLAPVGDAVRAYCTGWLGAEAANDGDRDTEHVQQQVAHGYGVAKLRDQLRFLAEHDAAAGDYDPWLRRLASIHEAAPDDATAHDLAHEYSAAVPGYDADEVDPKLASFTRGKPGNRGAGSIDREARALGWREPAALTALRQAEVALMFDDLDAGKPDAETVRRAFRVLDLDTAGAPRQPLRWLWAGYIPDRKVTRLDADGGAGKSFVVLMLAVCVALGLPFFGIPTERRRVVFFSAEDDEDDLRRRLEWICQRLGVDPAELRGWLHIADATEGDPVLFTRRRVEGIEQGATTRAYAELRDWLRTIEGGPLLIVDNASDVFDGDEINRAQQRGFVRALVALVKRSGGAVLVLGHVDKVTARAGAKAQGSANYSGSTAVNNSVRSRIFMVRDDDRGVIELHHEKCNLGPRQPVLLLRWAKDDIPRRLDPADEQRQRSDPSRFVPLLRELARVVDAGGVVRVGNAAAESVRNVIGPTLVQAGAIRGEGEALRLMNAAAAAGLVAGGSYRNPNTRKDVPAWVLTPAGRALVEAAGDLDATPADLSNAPESAGPPNT
jgi:hypothetical protein